jgi:ABC-type transport system involved in multi-copper enzyme maturation permease subunit
LITTPILRRELLVVVRRDLVHSQRVFVVAISVMIIVATFATWYYWAGGLVSHLLMADVAERSFLLLLAYHGTLIIGAAVLAAAAIAGEYERRTLDFLLMTRLSAAEIILEKLASFFFILLTTIAAGLPILLLVHLLGGIDPRVILLAYAALVTTGFFASSLSIWVSTQVPDSRRAIAASLFLIIVIWVIGPFFVPLVLSRFGLRLPGFLSTVNSLLLASSPMGLVMKVVMGVSSLWGLIDAVARMGALQVAEGIVLLVLAMGRLRAAYRANQSGEIRAQARASMRPVWTLRRRPAVGDDPILWREMHTCLGNAFVRFVGGITNLGVLVALAYFTYVFATPALVELWRHGYGSDPSSSARPEFNLFIRYFVPGIVGTEPADAARTALNLFVRYVSIALATFLSFAAMANAPEIFARERAKQTWLSLLATPLVARDYVRALLLAAAGRFRELGVVIAALWLIGLLAGAIHPLGFLVATLELTLALWFFAGSGILVSVRGADPAQRLGQNHLLPSVLLCSGVLPFLLPSWLNSALIGAGSPPYVVWLALVSYRDIESAVPGRSYPPLQWMGIGTREGPLLVMACCVIGMLTAGLLGWWYRRCALDQFDRRVGRPWREGPTGPTQAGGTALAGHGARLRSTIQRHEPASERHLLD